MKWLKAENNQLITPPIYDEQTGTVNCHVNEEWLTEHDYTLWSDEQEQNWYKIHYPNTEPTLVDMTDFNNFVAKCQQYGKKLWLRQVIVPGINDDEQHVLKLKQFASKLSNVDRIELLPYHSLGKSKYKNLGIQYRLDETSDMDKERCNN